MVECNKPQRRYVDKAPASGETLPEHDPQRKEAPVDNESLAQTGRQDSEEHEQRACRSCLGAGVVTEEREIAYCWWEVFQSQCPICKGAGTVSIFLYAHARSSR